MAERYIFKDGTIDLKKSHFPWIVLMTEVINSQKSDELFQLKIEFRLPGPGSIRRKLVLPLLSLSCQP